MTIYYYPDIIGKTVKGVVEKEETSDSTGGLGTETQFHILFEDGTSLVIWAYRPHVEYNTQQDGLGVCPIPAPQDLPHPAGGIPGCGWTDCINRSIVRFKSGIITPQRRLNR